MQSTTESTQKTCDEWCRAKLVGRIRPTYSHDTFCPMDESFPSDSRKSTSPVTPTSRKKKQSTQTFHSTSLDVTGINVNGGGLVQEY